MFNGPLAVANPTGRRTAQRPRHEAARPNRDRAIEKVYAALIITPGEGQHLAVYREPYCIISVPLNRRDRAPSRVPSIILKAGAPTLTDSQHMPSRRMRVGRCIARITGHRLLKEPTCTIEGAPLKSVEQIE